MGFEEKLRLLLNCVQNYTLMHWYWQIAVILNMSFNCKLNDGRLHDLFYVCDHFSGVLLQIRLW